jgi:hypothetical protein
MRDSYKICSGFDRLDHNQKPSLVILPENAQYEKNAGEICLKKGEKKGGKPALFRCYFQP